MTWKPLLFTGVIILILGGFYFLFYTTHSPVHPEDSPGTVIDGKRHLGETVASLRKKYPHLLPPSVEYYKKLEEKPTHTWEEWVDNNVELSMISHITRLWNDGNPLPSDLEAYDIPEKLAPREASFREFFEDQAKIGKGSGRSVPPITRPPLSESLKEVESASPKTYEGPQTTEAIMMEFDDMYTRIPSERVDRMEAVHPKETWIQDFLNKGAQFKHYDDYDRYLNSRAVFMNRSKDPSVWTSGIGGVHPASTLEAYKEAFIEREIWIQETWNRVVEENPDVTGMAIEGDNYLPFKDNLTYVRRNGPATTTWGTMLTDKQEEDLIMRGIHPKGIEIVYIDNDYNILSEKPPPWNPKSPDAKAVTEEVLKDMMPEIRTYEEPNVPIGTDTKLVGPDDELVVPDVDPDTLRRDAAREAAMAARDAAKAEYEKFENRMKQLEEFATMSDAEIEKKLERQFRKQFLPELPVEQLEQITPKRLERALGTLFQYGYEDGMRRIREDNATLADLLERHFGKRSQPPASVPKNPQRSVPPKPAETTDTSSDTD